MKTLIDLSNRAISEVRSAMAIGPSNQSSNIEHTSAWSAFADAVNFDFLSDDLPLSSLYCKDPIGNGIFAIRDAAHAAIAKSGNCGYMSALALKFIAEDPRFLGITATRKYFCEPFQHTMLELYDGKNIVYCDPWLNITLVGSENSIAVIADKLIEIESEHTNRLKTILDTSKFENLSPLDIDLDSTDENISEELENNFLAYCNKHLDWVRLQVNKAIKLQNEQMQKLLNFRKGDTSISQYLQNDYTSDSYYFVLSDTNKNSFLDLFELFYLLELKPLYPNSTELYTRICNKVETTRHLQINNGYAEQDAGIFSNWIQENMPSKEKPITPLLENIRKKNSSASTASEYCGMKKGFLLNKKKGLFS